MIRSASFLRAFGLAGGLLATSADVRAADAAECRARAALALAVAAQTPPTNAPTARAVRALAEAVQARCGHCRPEAEARQLAGRLGRPLVLFVGGCGTAGPAAVEAGAVAAIVERYDGDGRPAAEARAVVLTPAADGWYIRATVPVSAERVRAAVEAVCPPPEVPSEGSRPVPACSTGSCPLPASRP